MSNSTPIHNRIKKREVKNGKVYYSLEYPTEAFKLAACRGLPVESFYPLDDEHVSRDDEQVYRKLCAECPALKACLEWALVHEEFGVWGGTLHTTREKMREELGWGLNDFTLSARSRE